MQTFCINSKNRGHKGVLLNLAHTHTHTCQLNAVFLSLQNLWHYPFGKQTHVTTAHLKTELTHTLNYTERRDGRMT